MASAELYKGVPSDPHLVGYLHKWAEYELILHFLYETYAIYTTISGYGSVSASCFSLDQFTANVPTRH
jgi:hypothetical protein